MERHSIRLKGQAGVIRWGYQTAATVGAWTIENGVTGCDLTATVESVDHFRLSQVPLTFEANVGTGRWRWPVESVTVTEQTLIASLLFMEG